MHGDQLSHDWLVCAGIGHGVGNSFDFRQSSFSSKSPSGLASPPGLPGVNVLDLVRVAPAPHVLEQAPQLVQLVHSAGARNIKISLKGTVHQPNKFPSYAQFCLH